MNSLNKKIKVSGVTEPVGTGWLPPVPDLRDYTENHEEIKVFNQKLRLRRAGSTDHLRHHLLRQMADSVVEEGFGGRRAQSSGNGIKNLRRFSCCRLF